MSAMPMELRDKKVAEELSRGRVGMWCLIVAESAIFAIFAVAYVFYIGKSLSGPTPEEILTVPVIGTICLLSSSLTIHWATAALRKNNLRIFRLFWVATFALGALFLVGTGREWQHLIFHEGFTINTNLFGTSFYSLVGLHASHVLIGLIGSGLWRF